VKRALLAVAVCLGVSPAFATDWALNSTLSETVELNDNPFLRALAAGTFSSYSTIAANAVAKTPTSKFTFDGNVSYQKYWGPGVDGVPSENLAGAANLHYETFGKDSSDRQYLDAGWHRSNTAFALLGQLAIVTNAKGFIDTTTAGGGIDRSISALDTVYLSAHSTYTSYDPGTGGTPFIDTSADGTWRHRVNSNLSLSALSDAEFLHFDNALNTDLMILREKAGIDATLSPLLSFRGTAGIAYVQTERGTPAFSLPSTSNVSSSGSASGFIGDMVLTYKMFPDTTLTLNALQSISPSVVGSLIEATSIGAGLTRLVNSRETLSFSASASRQTSTGTTSDFFSGSIVYSYLLTREWNAQVSYRYLHEFGTSGAASAGLIFDPVTGLPLPIVSGSGPASSNSIMLVVSRSISILPGGQ
jgi:hypothetical protein